MLEIQDRDGDEAEQGEDQGEIEMRAAPERAVGPHHEHRQDTDHEERRVVLGEHREARGERGTVERGPSRAAGMGDEVESGPQQDRGDREHGDEQMVVKDHLGKNEDQRGREGGDQGFAAAQRNAVRAQFPDPPEEACDQDGRRQQARRTKAEEGVAEDRAPKPCSQA